MRPNQVPQVPKPEVVDLLSDSEDGVEDQEPDIVDLVANSEEDPEDPEVVEPEVIDLVSDSENDKEIPPVPFVLHSHRCQPGARGRMASRVLA
jgi:hypothetical protein